MTDIFTLRILGVLSTLLLGLGALRTQPDTTGAILDATPTPISIEADSAPSTNPQVTITQTSLPTTIATCEDAINLARQVGWPEDQLDTLAVVMLRESRCTPTAHNADDPHGGSYSLTQINGFWCEPNSAWPLGWLQVQDVGVTHCADLFIPEVNLRAALAIYNNSGWGPWAATAP